MPLYQVIHYGPSVGVGASQSVHLGIGAIGKKQETTNPYVIANELIAAAIGHYLRLPVPPCCTILDGEGNPHFASLNFNLTGESLPPIIPEQFSSCFAPAVADILIFDSYIANSDRHARNLSADYDAGQFNVFDHSHVLLSGTQPMGAPRLAAAATSLVIDGSLGGNRHCLIDFIEDDRMLSNTLQKIESIPDWFIDDVVEEASQYGLDANEKAQVSSFLKERRSGVAPAIARNKAAFKGIRNWSFL